MQLRQIFPPDRFILEFEGWPDIDQILSHFSIF